jgi:hypothetical protein
MFVLCVVHTSTIHNVGQSIPSPTSPIHICICIHTYLLLPRRLHGARAPLQPRGHGRERVRPVHRRQEARHARNELPALDPLQHVLEPFARLVRQHRRRAVEGMCEERGNT